MDRQTDAELFIAKPTEGTVIGKEANWGNSNLVNVRIADGVDETTAPIS